MEDARRPRPETRLRLTPKAIQSIEILQLATLDLKSLIEREMELNPTIEIENAEPACETERPPDKLEVEFERIESLHTDGKPLQKHLADQLSVLELSPREIEISDYLIHSIDDDGFLRFPLARAFLRASAIEPPVTVDEARSVLEMIKSLDPAGVGARDLRECLLLQLGREADGPTLEKQIVRDHLDAVMANRLPEIAWATGASLEKVDEAVGNVKRICNPKPGRLYSVSQVTHVADLKVEHVNGRWKVAHVDSCPRIQISRHYQELFRAEKDPRILAYVKQKIEAAKDLIESIEYREGTLLKIARAVVDRETPFLAHGIDAFRPLTLQLMADSLNMHVTTVSRAIADKYIETPHGVFALRFFFVTEKEARIREAQGKNLCRAFFLAALLAGLAYIFSAGNFAEHGLQRPAWIDSIAVAAGILAGFGARSRAVSRE
jgi:RNA polymerase sigma-54 factor